MPTDSDIIKQLEQIMDKKMGRELDNEIYWHSVHNIQNEHNQTIVLGISDCGLTELPLEITKLQNLTKLNLILNQLSDLPSEIGKLQNLTELDLRYNNLSNLPPEIGKLQNLTELDLYHNNLSNLPPEIGKLQNLTKLKLNYNNLSDLLPEIGKLQNLTDLDLSDNNLSDLPPEIGKLQNLTWLNLSNNNLSNLPPEIGKLQNLISLDLTHNNLSDLPPEIGKLQNLTWLNLGNNNLSNLPPEIGKLQNLTDFDLKSNQFSDFPSEIIKLQNLNILYLDKNQLSDLPPEIVKLQNLGVLSLGKNQLSDLPSEIVKLQNLGVLSLGKNQLNDLPPEIVKLQNLAIFDLSYNQLSQFPKTFLDLNLEVKWDDKCWESGIHVADNPFQTPPIEIVKQGREAIIYYYAALKEGQKRPLNESRLILIGDSGAGKTSLMKRLLGLDFNPHEPQTRGISINTFTLSHNDIKFHCWDFGGQQVMHATHQFFLSKQGLYLLVLDSRREMPVDYWLKHIQIFGKNAPVIIVINKIDENPHFDLPQQLKKRYPNIKQVCRISCATQEGMNELNRAIQNTLPDIESLHTVFPAKWFKVRIAITEQAKKINFTSYEHYVDICQANGITKESEQNILINFLHGLGLVHHFQDHWLCETNVINLQWIIEAVYTFINAPQLAGNGKLHRKQLTTLLDNDTYPIRKHEYLIELIKKFELCYAIHDNEYLLPDLFSTQKPDFAFDDEHALHFILEYDFLPKSLFTRLIVRMHRNIFYNPCWCNGVLFSDRANETSALVEVETDSNRIILKITGQQKREYLTILLFIFKDIHRSFNHLSVTEKFELPDEPNIIINYAHLLKLAKKRQSEYLPENSKKYYKIKYLLNIVTPPIEAMIVLQKIPSILENHAIEEDRDLLRPIFEPVDKVIKPNLGMFGVSIDVNVLLKGLRK